jgi:hypothetical protein
MDLLQIYPLFHKTSYKSVLSQQGVQFINKLKCIIFLTYHYVAAHAD